jgi:large subunit ribosomal protein L37Ae
MYSHTRKVGSLGRYGARVGRKIRHEARKIEDEANKPKTCRRCGKKRVKRNAAGIWTCRSCGLIFAGGAYTPVAVKRSVEQASAEAPAEGNAVQVAEDALDSTGKAGEKKTKKKYKKVSEEA